jgi:hypothetical protein
MDTQPVQKILKKIWMTMSLSKVWDRMIEDQVDGMCRTKYSEFFIMNGYKIERMLDGQVFIYDTRGESHFYSEIGPRERLVIERNGFVKGSNILTIDYLEVKLEEINELIRHYIDLGKDDLLVKAKEKRKRLISKIHKHYNKIK